MRAAPRARPRRDGARRCPGLVPSPDSARAGSRRCARATRRSAVSRREGRAARRRDRDARGTPLPLRREGADRSGRRRPVPRSTHIRLPAAQPGPTWASWPRWDELPSSARDRRLAAGRPSVPHVGCLLVVVRAVGELDGDCAVRLVEAPRALVLLEDPELEAVRPQGGHVLEERVTDAGPDLVRMDVEVREPAAFEDREATVEEVGLTVAYAATEVVQVLLVGMELRQEVEQRDRRREDRGDLLDVVGGRTPEHGLRLRGMRKRDEPVRLTRIYTRGGD